MIQRGTQRQNSSATVPSMHSAGFARLSSTWEIKKDKKTKTEFKSDFTSRGTSGLYLPSLILYHCCFELQFPSQSARSQILNCKLVPTPLVYSQSEQIYIIKKIVCNNDLEAKLNQDLHELRLRNSKLS